MSPSTARARVKPQTSSQCTNNTPFQILQMGGSTRLAASSRGSGKRTAGGCELSVLSDLGRRLCSPDVARRGLEVLNLSSSCLRKGSRYSSYGGPKYHLRCLQWLLGAHSAITAYLDPLGSIRSTGSHPAAKAAAAVAALQRCVGESQARYIARDACPRHSS